MHSAAREGGGGGGGCGGGGCGCKKSGTKVFFKFAQNLILCAHWPEVFIFEVLFRVAILFFEKNGF